MTASEVVRSVLLAGDELLRVEKLAVGARAHLIDDRGLQVHHHAARHVLARTRLAEEGVEGVVAAADGLVARHLTIRLDAVLEAEELPARVSDLDASLANVDAKGLTLCMFLLIAESANPRSANTVTFITAFNKHANTPTLLMHSEPKQRTHEHRTKRVHRPLRASRIVTSWVGKSCS